jgi:hypothetical protein
MASAARSDQFTKLTEQEIIHNFEDTIIKYERLQASGVQSICPITYSEDLKKVLKKTKTCKIFVSKKAEGNLPVFIIKQSCPEDQ